MPYPSRALCGQPALERGRRGGSRRPAQGFTITVTPLRVLSMEELANAVTHGIGLALRPLGAVLLMVAAAWSLMAIESCSDSLALPLRMRIALPSPRPSSRKPRDALHPARDSGFSLWRVILQVGFEGGFWNHEAQTISCGWDIAGRVIARGESVGKLAVFSRRHSQRTFPSLLGVLEVLSMSRLVSRRKIRHLGALESAVRSRAGRLVRARHVHAGIAPI